MAFRRHVAAHADGGVATLPAQGSASRVLHSPEPKNPTEFAFPNNPAFLPCSPEHLLRKSPRRARPASFHTAGTGLGQYCRHRARPPLPRPATCPPVPAFTRPAACPPAVPASPFPPSAQPSACPPARPPTSPTASIPHFPGPNVSSRAPAAACTLCGHTCASVAGRTAGPGWRPDGQAGGQAKSWTVRRSGARAGLGRKIPLVRGPFAWPGKWAQNLAQRCEARQLGLTSLSTILCPPSGPQKWTPGSAP